MKAYFYRSIWQSLFFLGALAFFNACHATSLPSSAVGGANLLNMTNTDSTNAAAKNAPTSGNIITSGKGYSMFEEIHQVVNVSARPTTTYCYTGGALEYNSMALYSGSGSTQLWVYACQVPISASDWSNNSAISAEKTGWVTIPASVNGSSHDAATFKYQNGIANATIGNPVCTVAYCETVTNPFGGSPTWAVAQNCQQGACTAGATGWCQSSNSSLASCCYQNTCNTSYGGVEDNFIGSAIEWYVGNSSTGFNSQQMLEFTGAGSFTPADSFGSGTWQTTQASPSTSVCVTNAPCR